MTRSMLTLTGALLAAATIGCAASNPRSGDHALWDQTRVQVALQLADEHIAAGKFDRARALLAAHATAEDERPQLRLARIDLEEGRYAAAAQRLDNIPTERRDSLLYDDTAAVTYEGLGRWGAAAAAYERAYRREPTAPRLVAWLEALVLAGRAAEARQTLADERLRFPGQPAVQDVAARLQAHLGNLDASIAELTSGLLHEPDSIALRRRLAETYMTAGHYVEALPIWRDLVAHAQNARQRRDARQQWATCLLASGQYAEAARVYRVITLTDPDDAPAHVGLAAAALADHRPAETVEAAQHALHLDPACADARLALACGYAALSEYGKAADVLAAGEADADTRVRELVARWRNKLTSQLE